MIIAKEIKEHKIKIKGQLLKQVQSYRHLGTPIEYNDKVNEEISERTGKVGRLFNMIKSTFFGRKEIAKEIKTQVYQKVRPSPIYGSESWTLSERNKRKVKATEMRFLRRIKAITRRDRIRNTIVVEELNMVPIEKAIEEIQLSSLGHVHRTNEERLAEEIFEVGLPGKTRWEDPKEDGRNKSDKQSKRRI